MGYYTRFKKWRSKGSTHQQPPDSSHRPLESNDKPVISTSQDANEKPENSPCPQLTGTPEPTLCLEPKGSKDLVQAGEWSSSVLNESCSVTTTLEDQQPDLWQLSFDKLSTEEKGRLNSLLKSDQAPSSDLTSPKHFTSQSFDELILITSEKQTEMLDRAWEFKIRGRSIKPKEYTGRILECLTAVGDVSVPFMPQPASIVWPLVKGLMQVPVNADAETAAILMTADLLVRTITCGKGYESAYAEKFEKIGPGLWKSLQSALVELYVASLKLLALALEECEKRTARRLVEAFLNPQKSQGQVSNVHDCHSNLRQVAQSCQTKVVGDIDKSMTEFLDKFADLNLSVESHFGELFEKIEEWRRTQILDWISKAKPFDRHSTIKATRAPETCGWLLQSKEFIDWKHTFAPAVLWLQGSPGTGKTFLTSSVIDHLYEDIEAEEGLAFYYCQRSGDKLEDSDDLIRSIFRQLATRPLQENSHQMRKDIQDLFSKSKDQMSRPEISTSKLQILNSIDQYSRITLVIDALDECAEPKKELFDLIESMVSQSKCPVRVFLSARPNFGVEDQFSGKATIKTELHQVESDIEKFIHHEIAEFPMWSSISKEIQVEAIESLKQKSEGMFQWVSLHIEQLRTCEMDDDVLFMIERMPKGLLATYRYIYDQISTHPSQKTIVDRAFLWLMYSNNGMDTEEVLEAICHDANHNRPAKKIEKDKFLKLCKNLVIFDASADRFRFCHASVSEYIADSLWTPEDSHCYAAKTCLRHLFLAYGEPAEATGDSSRPGRDGITTNVDGRMAKALVTSSDASRFHRYCGHNWFHHVQCYEAMASPSQLDANLISLLKSFLKSPLQSGHVYKSWHREFSDNIEFEGHHVLTGDISPPDLPILAMCFFAIGTSLLADGWWNVTEECSSLLNSKGDTLLILAVLGGSLRICEALVESGVHIDHIGSTYSALHYAAYFGRFEIARLLLENAATVNIKGLSTATLIGIDCIETPLTLAAQNGDHQMIRLLVEKGANVNYVPPGGYRRTALCSSVRRGDLEAARFLLDHGADLNFPFILSDPEYRFQDKPSNREDAGEVEITSIHIECENEVNMELDQTFDSTLSLAIGWGNLDMAELLINYGADVNMVLPGACGSALSIAVRMRRPDIAQFLINHGADVDMVLPGSYGSALAIAVDYMKPDLVELLINQGADVNMRLTGIYGSALAVAAECGRLDIVKLLINYGADVNLELPGIYGSALAVAVRWKNFDVAELLIENGADVNMELTGIYGSALAVAADCEDIDVAELLISRASDVSTELPAIDGSDLVVPVQSKSLDIVELLINRGADVNMELPGIYGSALAFAARRGRLDVVELLIQHGANVNLPLVNGIYGTALHAACYWGWVDLVQTLLDAGANIYLPQEHSGFKDAFEAAEAEITYAGEEHVVAHSGGRNMAECEANKTTVMHLLIDHVGIFENALEIGPEIPLGV